MFGMFTYHCLYSAYTDMIGKEKLLSMIERNWINTNIYMWAVMWLMGLGVLLFSEMKEVEGKE